MTNPFAVMQSSITFWTLMAEAQTVIALRLMGMAGVLPADASENRRMMAEKGPAFASAMTAAAAAVLRGHAPDQVALAAMRPLRRRTRANVRRLSKSAWTGGIR